MALLLTVLFIALYCEPLTFAGVKVSHAWKFTTELCLGLYLVNAPRVPRAWKAAVVSVYLWALWPAVAAMAHASPGAGIFAAGQRLLPAMGLHAALASQLSSDTLRTTIRAVAVFVLMAAVPFQFGLLNPLGEPYPLREILGIDVDAFVGVFQQPHIAALSIALAIVGGCWWALESAGRERVAIVLGCAYGCLLLVETYVRTGLVCATAGIVVLLAGRGRRIVHVLIVVTIAGLVGGGIWFTGIADGLRQRAYGTTQWQLKNDFDLATFSSGRTTIWANAIANLSTQGISGWAFGIGEDELKREMEASFGRAVFAHNGVLNDLCCYGAVGLAGSVMFLSLIGGFAWRARRHDGIGISAVAVWLVYYILQGGEAPLQQLFVFLCVAKTSQATSARSEWLSSETQRFGR